MVSTDQVLYPLRSGWPVISYSPSSTVTWNEVGPTDATGIEWTTSCGSTEGDYEVELRGVYVEEPEPLPQKPPPPAPRRERLARPVQQRRHHSPPGGWGFYRG